MKDLKKIILLILVLIILFFTFKIIQKIKCFIDEDFCVDTGICAEGLRFGENILTKEYCLKKHFKWDDKRKECDMAIESRTCREQGYEWITTEGRCSNKIIKNW
ncbi:MAG: hypothetical protein WCY19_05810 [Candidatus Gastranaerophilaceae bacterium]